MKRNPGFILRLVLLIGDLTAVVIAFGLAYYYRTHFDPRPYAFGSNTLDFILTMGSLLPIWAILLFVAGVYDKSIYPYRPKLYWRLLVASAVGTMSVIAISYLTESSLLPARLIIVYAFFLCFILLVLIREIIGVFHRTLLRHGVGVLGAIVVGNNENTGTLIEYLHKNLESGYKVVGAVAQPEYIPKAASVQRYLSLTEAIQKTAADVVIQTDEHRTEKIYFDTVDHHMSYLYVPSQKVLLSHMGEMHIMGSQPVVHVHTTPLIGGARVVKRLEDIVFGSVLTILALPIMVVVALIIKLSSPRSKVIYKAKRLSRFGKAVTILKFRTLKSEFSDMSPEAAFKKMGRPELAKKYRAEGDQIDNDPRLSRAGAFLRKTSLDELPQLCNVLVGTISLVGPRALMPEELDAYHNKNLILSVKSGLTGLAQVSGRRNISFEERRALDVYYIQNWSLDLDIQILLKTILSVLLQRGAR